MEGEPPQQEHQPNNGEVLQQTLELRALADPLVEQLGYEPRSYYVEVCWLPILGPTASWLYRRLGTWAQAEPDGSKVDLVDLSVSLGLGESLGHRSKLARGLKRLVQFDIARWQGDALAVRTALAPLPEQRAMRLSDSAYRFHRQARERRASGAHSSEESS